MYKHLSPPTACCSGQFQLFVLIALVNSPLLPIYKCTNIQVPPSFLILLPLSTLPSSPYTNVQTLKSPLHSLFYCPYQPPPIPPLTTIPLCLTLPDESAVCQPGPETLHAETHPEDSPVQTVAPRSVCGVDCMLQYSIQ